MKWIHMLLLMTLAVVAGMLLPPADADAAEVTFIWDARPAAEGITEYRLYLNAIPEPYKIVDAAVIVGGVAETTATVADPAGTCWSVTASNELGESEPSESVCLPQLPGMVEGFKILLIHMH